MTIADTLPSNGNIFDGIKVLKQKTILIQLSNQMYNGINYLLCKYFEKQTLKNTGKKLFMTVTKPNIIVMIKHGAKEYMYF